MPVFAYRARNQRGELLTGRIESGSAAAVADELLRTGLTPIELKVQATASAQPSLLQWLKRRNSVSDVELMLFTRQIASMLKAGVPILRALATLAEATQQEYFRGVLDDIREGLGSGRELSACMHKHPKVFQPFMVSMVRVGETTGRLDEVFMRLFHHLEFEREMHSQVKSALRYPSFVIVALVLAIGILNVMVIPTFARVYKSAHAELPLITRFLITFSDLTVQWWPVLLGALILGFVWLRWWIATPTGHYKWDRFLLKVPIVGKIVHKVALARFARGMAMTYQSGVPIVQGLTSTAQVVGNRFIADRIDQMCVAVERGEALTRTAHTAGVFTPVVLQMLAVGEETGELDRLLAEIAEMYQREVEYEVATLSEQIEPILIASLGGVVLIVALGIFLPMWDLGSTLLHKK